MSTQIREIVDLLNRPPFGHNFSLVTFDEQQPHQLMLLLNEVLGHIDESQKVDMTREDPVMAQNRIIQFLHVVAYRPADPATFMMNLFNGDRDVCYTLLEWLLKSLDDHKKRAYLAPYLTEIDVPQDLFADEMVMEIKQSCSNLKEEFIHSHKQLAILEEATQDPNAKKEMIQNLTDERRHLSERVSRLEKKLQGNLENFEGMHVVCKRLRRELDDEKALRQKHKDQTESLQSAKRAQAQAKERLEKIRNEQGHMLDGDAVTMLAKLEEDIVRKRKQAHEDLPHEMAESRRKLAETQSIVSGQSFTEHDVQQLMAQKRRLDQECERMAEEKRNPPAADDKIIMFRQQAGMMERKKEQLLQKLEEEKGRRAALEKEIEEKENSFEAMGSMGHMSGDDFRRIKQDFRAKSTQYKRMKAELNELRAEKGVLQRTVAILESRCHDLDGFVQEQETKAGVAGAAKNLQELESVAAKKSEYDKRKGMTLQEHSEEVDKIRQIIKEKKQKLAPMIKELRAARGEFQQMDGLYQEQKGMYDQFKLKFDCEFEELETDCSAFRSEIEKAESQLHHRNAMKQITSVAVKRAEEEVQAKTSGTRVGPNQEYGSYRDMYEDRIRMTTDSIKQLREQRKYAEENYEPNLVQMKIFTGLQNLLSVKLQVIQSGQGNMFGENDMSGGINQVVAGEQGGAANVFTLDS